MMRRLSRSTLFPYASLFRSRTLETGRCCLRRGEARARIALRMRVLERLEIDAVDALVRGLFRARRKLNAHLRRRHGRALVRRSEEHTSELQSPDHLVYRLLL